MRVFRSRRIRNHERRRGAALVETAIVLPIFLIIIVGIVEFGRALMVAQLLNNAAREGTRVASMAGSTNASVDDAVRTFAASSIGVAADELAVTIEVTAAPGNPDPNDDVSVAMKRDLIEVEVQVDFADVSYVPGEYINGALRGQAAMRHE
jgi:Flp pilus assembly protein TadG